MEYMKLTNSSKCERLANPVLVGVIGGTPFDAHLGKTLLLKHGIKSIEAFLSNDPLEQTKLQVHPKKATQITREKISYLKLLGCDYIFIYCNSLSSVIDLNDLRASEKIPIITPFEVYIDLLSLSDSIGVMTANQHSLHKLRDVVQSIDKQKKFTGKSFLPMVSAIEQNMPSSDIIETFHLLQFCKNLAESGIKILILGCTHFSTLYSELTKLIRDNNLALQVYDPSTCMVNFLLSNVRSTRFTEPSNRQIAHT